MPIPGTSSVAHLEENLQAALLHLSQAEFDELAVVEEVTFSR
jgi:aryl-alcohol dehydrogenase-like predicted oxidoreductase